MQYVKMRFVVMMRLWNLLDAIHTFSRKGHGCKVNVKGESYTTVIHELNITTKSTFQINHVLLKLFDIYECYTSTVNFFKFSPNQKLKVIK